MNIVKILAYIILCFALFVFGAFFFVSFGFFEGLLTIVFLVMMVLYALDYFLKRNKVPGGPKGMKLQGIWVLERHLKFDPALRKWEEVPVESKKNYFEFKDSNFRSGDFDEKHKQLPAEDSAFSIEGENIIFKLESLSKANWKWSVKGGKLELTGEMLYPKDSKSQFIFYRKNWA